MINSKWKDSMCPDLHLDDGQAWSMAGPLHCKGSVAAQEVGSMKGPETVAQEAYAHVSEVYDMPCSLCRSS